MILGSHVNAVLSNVRAVLWHIWVTCTCHTSDEHRLRLRGSLANWTIWPRTCINSAANNCIVNPLWSPRRYVLYNATYTKKLCIKWLYQITFNMLPKCAIRLWCLYCLFVVLRRPSFALLFCDLCDASGVKPNKVFCQSWTLSWAFSFRQTVCRLNANYEPTTATFTFYNFLIKVLKVIPKCCDCELVEY